jgi:glyceraldehyde 3-phosphate dehydrogenase
MRVAINGFGRIGRAFLRAAVEREAPFEIVAINDLGDAETMAHLLRYDSVLGPFRGVVSVEDGKLHFVDRTSRLLSESDPADLPWADLGVDVAIESTGRFRKREQLVDHLAAGAGRVIVSAPAKDPDVTLVLGVNDEQYDPEAHRLISNASCTTNCVAPVVKVLHDTFGVESGFMTTIHAYTNDQSLLDQPHKDARRARAAALNLIPTSTGAAKAIGLVIPELAGRLDGVAVRAPVADGSLVDLSVRLARPVTVDEVNAAFASAAGGEQLAGILQYSDEPLVSSDVIANPASAVVDSGLTMANGHDARVFAWYDNEWGYACRLIELVTRVGTTSSAPRVPLAAAAQ